MRVWRFDHEHAGSRCWWSLSDMYAAADKPFGMSASQWYHSWWPWWRKRIDALSYEPVHLRRAAPTSQSVAAHGVRDEEADTASRVLPSYSMSMFAMMALLLGWYTASTRGKKKEKPSEAPAKFESFAQMLLRTYLVDDWQVDISMRQDVAAIPGLPFSREESVSLAIGGDGIVDLSPLAADALADSGLLSPFRNCTKVGILRLLKGWASRKQFFFAFKQLVVAVATSLEEKIQLSSADGRTDDNDEASVQALGYCAHR